MYGTSLMPTTTAGSAQLGETATPTWHHQVTFCQGELSWVFVSFSKQLKPNQKKGEACKLPLFSFLWNEVEG